MKTTLTPIQTARSIGRFSSYTVRIEHETDCTHCGSPVLVNDTAHEVKSHLFDDAGYCSKKCAETALSEYLEEHFQENFTAQVQKEAA